MKKLFFRFLMITFWISFIFLCLYLPKWDFLSSNQDRINIFTWGDILAPSVIEAFEKETHIKVHLNYYSSNEELLVKLKATKGLGYDLVIPSDYAVSLLGKEDLLKPLKKQEFHFWQTINPALLGHFFDEDNDYSIPFAWEIYGLGIDQTYFSKPPLIPSWKLIFDHSIINYKISMVNDPIEAIFLASTYLFGNINKLNPEQTQMIKNLLLEQKSWVEAYANFRGDYFLATKNCPVVVASSSYISRGIKQFPFISFIIPNEGSCITIENLCIPKSTKKEKLVYQFINYLFHKESIRTHHAMFGFFPSAIHALDELDLTPESKLLIQTSKEDLKKFQFIKSLLPKQELIDLWVEIKNTD